MSKYHNFLFYLLSFLSFTLLAVPENPSKALEAQLAHRPDVQDLIDRNIMKGIIDLEIRTRKINI